jgi:hypothetical protein
MVAPQNIENNEVPCKIFQDKELRGCFEGLLYGLLCGEGRK